MAEGEAEEMNNLWLDMPYEMKVSILDKAVKAGYLKKKFVEDLVLEVREMPCGGKKRKGKKRRGK